MSWRPFILGAAVLVRCSTDTFATDSGVDGATDAGSTDASITDVSIGPDGVAGDGTAPGDCPWIGNTDNCGSTGGPCQKGGVPPELCCVQPSQVRCSQVCNGNVMECRTNAGCATGDAGITLSDGGGQVCCLHTTMPVSAGCPAVIEDMSAFTQCVDVGTCNGQDTRLCTKDVECGLGHCVTVAFVGNPGYTFGICE
jgi:hypothetical protein